MVQEFQEDQGHEGEKEDQEEEDIEIRNHLVTSGLCMCEREMKRGRECMCA